MAKVLKATQSSNADQAKLVFEQRGFEGGYNIHDPVDQNTKVIRRRLVFLMLHAKIYEIQKGRPPPEGWWHKYTELANRLGSCDLKLRTADYTLPSSHWYIEKEHARAVERAQVPMSERREEKRKSSSKASMDGSIDESVQSTLDGDLLDGDPDGDGESQSRNSKRQKIWGEAWEKNHKRLAAKGNINDRVGIGHAWGPYTWVHPRDNSQYREVYSNNAWFEALSWRYQDVVLHHDRTQPVNLDVDGPEEFIPMCAICIFDELS